jgi:hypothetical protein
MGVTARSPWVWPIAPLAIVAAVGQWQGVAAAEATAALFVSLGIGILIGLALGGPRKRPEALRADTRSQGGAAADEGSAAPKLDSPRTADLRGAQLAHAKLMGADLRQADLRGAQLAHAKLMRADLRQADLRGATLIGADLSGADLTDARLGPLSASAPGN